MDVFILPIAATLLACVCIAWLFWPQKESYEIPGPPGWPLIGNALDIEAQSMHIKLLDWHQKYGPIFKFSTMGTMNIVVTGREGLNEVLLKHGQELGGRKKSYREELLTEGNSGIIKRDNGEKLRRIRKFIHKELHLYGSGLAHIEQITLDELEEFIEDLSEQNEQPIDFFKQVNHSVRAIMYILLFSEKPNKNSGVYELLHKAGLAGGKALDSDIRGILLDKFPLIRYFGSRSYRAIKDSCDLFAAMYNDCKKKYENGVLSGIAKDMFDEHYAHTNTDFTESNIKLLLQDIIGAGTSTTTSALSGFFNILLFYKDVCKKIQEEIDEVVGDGRMVKIKDLENMSYVKATLLEILRYVTPVALSIPHVAMVDTKVLGYNIPKGTTVLPNLWAQNHDEKVWGDPWTFRPERFLESEGKVVDPDHPLRLALFAFGDGPRRCIGANLAFNRMFLYVGNILQRFTVLPATSIDDQPSCHPNDQIFHILVNPLPYKIRFVPRA